MPGPTEPHPVEANAPAPASLKAVSPEWKPWMKWTFVLSLAVAALAAGLRVLVAWQGEDAAWVPKLIPGAEWFFDSHVRKAHWVWPDLVPDLASWGLLLDLVCVVALGGMALAALGLPPLRTATTRLRLGVVLSGCFVIILAIAIHLSVAFESEVSSWPPQLGMHWQDESDVRVSWWRWPEITFLETELVTISLRANVLVDMLAAVSLAVALTLLLSQASLRRWRPRRYWKVGAISGFSLAVLVFTFHWCGVDPMGVWQSRGNAFEHVFGRIFTEEEISAIRADARRAPDYYAMGEANYIIGEKYKDVPASETPTWKEKQDEMEAIKARLLAGMSPEERQEIVDKEYQRLLSKKRGGYFPPETAWAHLKTYWDALMETVAIAIWASLLAVVCAIPLSILAASNTLAIIAPGDAPYHRALRWFGVFVVRRFLDSCRGFNELVMALIFVSVIGLGPFAGILALWIHTTGILGKIFSEAIEAIDPGQVEALQGVGANPLQSISFSVMPQVMPTVISYSLLRFESNVRSAAILGWVGAGGIGFLLQDKMNGYSYREVCTMMIMIILAVCVIDYFCGRLRRRFI